MNNLINTSLVCLLVSLSSFGQKIRVTDVSGMSVPFCHVCDLSFDKCNITDLDGWFDLAPFLQATDSIVLKHVGFETKVVAIRQLPDQIIMKESITQLNQIYVTDIGPRDILEKAIKKTNSYPLRNDRLWRRGFEKTFLEDEPLDTIEINDTIVASSSGDHNVLFKFLSLEHSGTRIDYLDEYSYELTGFYENGMVIEQHLLGLDDHFHFQYFINDSWLIERIYFQYQFDLNQSFNFMDTVSQKYLWKGNIQFALNDQKLFPKELLLEDHYLVKESRSFTIQQMHRLSVFKLSSLD